MKKMIRNALALFATVIVTLGGTSLNAYAAPVQMEDGTIFDAEYYAQSNPDVVAALGTSSADMMWLHYQVAGRAEGRAAVAGATVARAATPAASTASLAALAGKTGCVLLNGNTVGLSLALAAAPASDDGVLYVVKLAPFESVPSTAPIAQVAAAANPQASFALDPATGLYSKYAFAVKQGGAIKVLGTPQYITNPEVLATATRPFQALPAKSLQDERTTFWNYWIDKPAGTNGAGAGTQMLQVLNSGSDATLIHPLARAAAAAHQYDVDNFAGYYMLNAADWSGISAITTKLHNVATATPTQDFVIGNEVNERKWNFIPYGAGWDVYVREYYNGFRVAYNAIKSANANARVFISIDQRWDAMTKGLSGEARQFIDGKLFLDKFNALCASEGNIDWAIAAHPHYAPLTWSRFWDYNGSGALGSVSKPLVDSNQFMTITNASMLTNYLQQPQFLSPTGKVRTVVYSEITVAASPNDASQAAALYMAYYATVTNPYVEAIIFAQDASTNAYFGATTRQIYSIMGTERNAEAEAFFQSTTGHAPSYFLR